MRYNSNRATAVVELDI